MHRISRMPGSRTGSEFSGSRSITLLFAIALVVCALSARAGSPERWTADTHGQGFGLWLRAKPVPSIPLNAPDAPDAMTSGEKLALLADHGHAVWLRVRETQDDYCWFAGEVEPAVGAREFIWPSTQQLALVLRDGRRVPAREIVATQGHPLVGGVPGPMPIISIYPAGIRLRFEDFMTEFPSGAKCAIYVAFPWQDWHANDVAALAILNPEPSSSDASVPREPAAAAPAGSLASTAQEGDRR